VFVIIDIDGLLQAIKLQSGATTDRPIETGSRVQATSVAIDRIHIQPVLYGSSKVEEGKLAAAINLQNQSLNKSIMTCIINVEFYKIAVFTHWGQAAGYQPRPQAGGWGDGHQIWWLAAI